jgi:hypothetical protein
MMHTDIFFPARIIFPDLIACIAMPGINYKLALITNQCQQRYGA